MTKRTIGSVSLTDSGWALALFAASAILFVWRIWSPEALVFDETHYVPAGRDYFEMTAWTNGSHPPFGKWMIGLGCWLFGDNSFGWRFFGAVLGAATVTCVYAVMRLFGFGIGAALGAGALTMFNQTLFVQARTAMLDIYFLSFFAISILLMIWSAKRARSAGGATLGLVLSGVFLGLSAASKWMGGINMILVWIGLFIWRCTETSPRGVVLPRLFNSGFAGWNRLSFVGAGLRQGVPALLVYVLTFLPFLAIDGFHATWQDFLSLHERMFHDVAGNLKDHPYASRWWTWPAMLEPIWYHFARPDGQTTGDAAILLIGNPAVHWAGLPLIVATLLFGLKRADGALLAISGAYFAFWLIWAAIPRELSFFFYYEPAALMLGMGIAGFAARIAHIQYRMIILGVWVAAAAGFFIYFYPVLACMPLQPEQWNNWVWFNAWR